MSEHNWQFEDGCYENRTVAQMVRSPRKVGQRAVDALVEEWKRAVVDAHEEYYGYPHADVLERVCGTPYDDYLSMSEWFSLWLVTHKGWSWVPMRARSIADYGSSFWPADKDSNDA